MGYRSSVEYIIQHEEVLPDGKGETPQWALFISEAKVNPATKLAMDMVCHEGEFAEEEDRWAVGGLDMESRSIHMHFDDAKWYDSFDEVISFKALMEMAQQYPQLEGAYARKGEDDDDCEVENFGSATNGNLITLSHDYYLNEDEIRYPNYKYESVVETSQQLEFEFYGEKL